MSVLNAFTDEERDKLYKLGHIASGTFTTKVNTTITNAGQYYKVLATFTELSSNGFTWNGTLKRWEYFGPDTVISIFGTFIGSHGDTVASHDCKWKFFKNGTDIGTPPAGRIIPKNETASITLMIPSTAVTTGDYFELYATIDNAGEDIGTENMNFLVR